MSTGLPAHSLLTRLPSARPARPRLHSSISPKTKPNREPVRRLEGHKTLKRYGLVFTCLASRALHLETLNSVEADSFISALRRFINRRGKVRELRSDQGTNFVGAKNELAAALQEPDQARVKEFLCAKDCDWINFNMNIPAASHMGGIWERMIKSVRSVLSVLLQEQGA